MWRNALNKKNGKMFISAVMAAGMMTAAAAALGASNGSAAPAARPMAAQDTVEHFGWKRDRVQAKATDVYHITFEAGQPVRMAVVGDGDTDLDLHVYDENGNLIASDTDLSDVCEARWTPQWTGRFRIVITNHGRVWNEYVFVAMAG